MFCSERILWVFCLIGSNTEGFLKQNEKCPCSGVCGRINYCNLLTYWRSNRPGPPAGCHLLCWAELLSLKNFGGCKRSCDHSVLCSTFLATDTVVSLSRHRTMQTKWCDALFAVHFLPPVLESVGLLVLQESPFICTQGLAAKLTATAGAGVWSSLKEQSRYDLYLLCSIAYI